MRDSKEIEGLLIFPRLKVQNANTISSPLTWGFPSMTAFLGLMWALERKINDFYKGIVFESVGVISHSFDPQISGVYQKSFNLTRNPILRTGDTRPIAEEGRAHLEITLVFSVAGKILEESAEERKKIAKDFAGRLETMRIAGGTIVKSRTRGCQPDCVLLAENFEERLKQFKRLRRSWLPGSTLVLRDDLMQERLKTLKDDDSSATIVDAWLDLSRVAYNAEKPFKKDEDDKKKAPPVKWAPNRSPGWLVPIPVGYGALSDIFPAGTVENSRDDSTDFRFVESLYSIGEWIAPHKLEAIEQMLWHSETEPETGIYKCTNNFVQIT